MKINTKYSLNEKEAKELISSLKRLIRYVFDNFETNVENNNIQKLSIHFDNEDIFSIRLAKNKNTIIKEFDYINGYGKELNTLSVQQALNINKYSLDIINMLKQNKNEYYIEAYFTEQSLSDLKIFDYNNIGLEQKIKDEKADIEIENI